jgi:molybdenum cofactor sulfurtransferase
MRISKRFNQGKVRSVLRGEDLGNMSDSELTFAENLFRARASSATSTPVKKKLQRSRHTIDTTLIPAVLDKLDVSSPRRSSVSVASRRSVDVIHEFPRVITRRSWLSEWDNNNDSNARRKSCEPVMLMRQNGDSNRSSDHTFNSGRSWAWSSDEDLGRSMSTSTSFQSHDDDDDEALEFFDAEERFLQSNPDYTETRTLDAIRRDQYPKLSVHRHVYMDYASLALSSRFQMEQHMRLVMAEGHMFGTKSTSSAEYAASAQSRLLEMLHTSRSEYCVVFTTGMKASYRLVASAYPFQKGSPLLLCQDNHDAVNQVTSLISVSFLRFLKP